MPAHSNVRMWSDHFKFVSLVPVKKWRHSEFWFSKWRVELSLFFLLNITSLLKVLTLFLYGWTEHILCLNNIPVSFKVNSPTMPGKPKWLKVSFFNHNTHFSVIHNTYLALSEDIWNCQKYPPNPLKVRDTINHRPQILYKKRIKETSWIAA